MVGFFCVRLKCLQIDLEQGRAAAGGFPTCKALVISLPFGRLYFWVVKSL